MTTDKTKSERKDNSGLGDERGPEAIADERLHDDPLADRAEDRAQDVQGKVKEKAEETQEQATRPRVRHNRG